MKNVQTFYFQGLENKEKATEIERVIENKTRVDKAVVDAKKGTVKITIGEDYEKLTVDAVQNIFDSVTEGIIVSDIKKSEAVTSTLLYFTTAVAILLFILVRFVGFDGIYSTLFSAVALILAGYDTLIKAVKGIFNTNIDQNLLLSAACIAGFFTDARLEAILVLIIYRIASIIVEHIILRIARKKINKYINIAPKRARIQLEDGTYKEVPAKKVPVGSVVLLNPYERLALDGVVIEGEGKIDISSVTGDDRLLNVTVGDTILSGSICQDMPLHIETTTDYENSTATAIVNLIRNSTSKKAKLEKTVFLISKIAIPIIFLLAGFISYFYSPYCAVCMLVAASPCALLSSVPIGFFASIGMLSTNGALIKGGRSLENLAKATNVAFDKTGTLTSNNLEVTEIIDVAGVGRESILTLCAALEQFSNHPVAKAVLKESAGLELPEVSSVKEKAGYGITAEVNGKYLLCGSQKLLETCGISTNDIDANLYLSFGKKLLGAIRVSSHPLKSAPQVIADLKDDGVNNVFMLSGDNAKTARQIASKIGINKVVAPLLPEEKAKVLKQIEKDFGPVLYVGDGVNDEDVISSAQTGISMGLANTVATNTAEIVLVRNKLLNLPKVRSLAYKAVSKIDFNIWLASVVKVLLLLFCFFGYAGMLVAILTDVALTLITLFNSVRILKIK